VQERHSRGNFVRVDMEDSDVTQVTIDIFKRLRAEFDLNTVGIVLQSYLRRTYADAQELLKIPARIRICKGAYHEPPEVAFPDKKDVDANYVKVMQLLLSSGTYHGIATHDPKMIDATVDFASREGIGKDKFEFQMLFGIRRDLQRQLARDGYNMRIYVPYGKHWYPYFMRRLAERPANVWFVMKNVFKVRDRMRLDDEEWIGFVEHSRRDTHCRGDLHDRVRAAVVRDRRAGSGVCRFIGIDSLAIQFMVFAVVSLALTAASRTIFINYFRPREDGTVAAQRRRRACREDRNRRFVEYGRACRKAR
jgi:proline dehydrogenase